MTSTVLVLNAGSSSVKFSLYRGRDAVLRGAVEGLGDAPQLRVLATRAGPGAAPATGAASAPAAVTPLPRECDHAAAVLHVRDAVARHAAGLALDAVGHRVVHGGMRYSAPVRVTQRVQDELDSLVPLAPLHQPQSLAAIRALAQDAPSLPQVACFDTQFHRTQPEVAQAYALPPEVVAHGIRRYGFHGLSYEHVADRLPALDARAAGGRTVVAHLGNGASMCALREGRSVATTMGFTALDGLMMGTRAGSLDPGVLLYLQSTLGYGVDDVTRLLYERSGLLGVSGVSADMRTLLASADPRAAAAVELFCYRAGRELGSLAAALGGLDALVFTGGIGEHAAPVRERIVRAAAWLGLALDPEANARHASCITLASSAVPAYVVAADEEAVIVRQTRRVLGLAD